MSSGPIGGIINLEIPIQTTEKQSTTEKSSSQLNAVTFVYAAATHTLNQIKNQIYSLGSRIEWSIHRLKDLKEDEDGLLKTAQLFLFLAEFSSMYFGTSRNKKFEDLVSSLTTIWSFGFLRLGNTITGYINESNIDDIKSLGDRLKSRIIEYAPDITENNAEQLVKHIFKVTLEAKKGYFDVQKDPNKWYSFLPLNYYKDAIISQLVKAGIKDEAAQAIVLGLNIKIKSNNVDETADLLTKIIYYVQSFLQAVSTISFSIVVDTVSFFFIPVSIALEFESVAASVGNYPVMDRMITTARIGCAIGFGANFIQTCINLANKKEPLDKALLNLASSGSECILNILALIDVNRTAFLVWGMITKFICVMTIFDEIRRKYPYKEVKTSL